MRIAIPIVLLLAVIQGLTEFLPVSSSGHLVLVEALLGVRREGGGIIFEVAVHVGTLGAVLLVYRRRIIAIIGGLADFISSGFKRKDTNRDDVAYAGLIIVASLPAAAAGVLLRDFVTGAFDAPEIASGLLIFTGCYLLLSRRRRSGATLTWMTALVIGVSQAIAILPGCSRSGWTIATALLLGIGFKKGAEFSFILSIPAIIGALFLEVARNPGAIDAGSAPALLIGMTAAFLSGWIALRLLLGVLARGLFHRFAYYCIPVGTIALVYFARAG